MPDEPLLGGLFTRNYLRPEKRLADSIRARRRFLRAFMAQSDDVRSAFVGATERRLGVDYPVGPYNYHHQEYWTECETGDFLSSITILYGLTRAQAAFLAEARTILEEEALLYRIDDAGGVHYVVDEEFARNTELAISGLGAPRYVGAKHALEAGLSTLSQSSPSGKALIRGTFEAVESAFLVTIADPQINRLSEAVLVSRLRPKLLERYQQIPGAEDKVDRIIDTFGKWIKAAHPYRHGATFEEVHEAPLDEAIALSSIGMAFIRYLIA